MAFRASRRGQSFLGLFIGGTQPPAAIKLISDAGYRVMRDTKTWERSVRFQSHGDMIAGDEKA